MFKSMRNGINHQIPVQTSFNLFKYFNINPSFNYQERWYFQKVDKEWDPVAKQVIDSDTTWGFYRLYNYSMSVSASTKVYGTYQFKKGAAIQAIRHMITPSVSFSYTPRFRQKRLWVLQTGAERYYGAHDDLFAFCERPLRRAGFRTEHVSLNFSVSQTLEMKVRDKKDTTGGEEDQTDRQPDDLLVLQLFGRLAEPVAFLVEFADQPV